MKEMFKAVYEILNAATAGVLLGSTVVRNEQEGLSPSTIWIDKRRAVNVGSGKRYIYQEGHIGIAVLIQIDQLDGGIEHRREKEEAAEDLMRAVQAVISSNPELVSTTYTAGITGHPELTEFGETEYAEFIHAHSGEYVFARVDLKARYIIRNGALSLR